MKIIELVLDDDQITGIEAISVVENPAIEEDFIYSVLYLFLTNQYTDAKAMMSTTFTFLKVR
jgi:hypothetical protein